MAKTQFPACRRFSHVYHSWMDILSEVIKISFLLMSFQSCSISKDPFPTWILAVAFRVLRWTHTGERFSVLSAGPSILTLVGGTGIYQAKGENKRQFTLSICKCILLRLAFDRVTTCNTYGLILIHFDPSGTNWFIVTVQEVKVQKENSTRTLQEWVCVDFGQASGM